MKVLVRFSLLLLLSPALSAAQYSCPPGACASEAYAWSARSGYSHAVSYREQGQAQQLVSDLYGLGHAFQLLRPAPAWDMQDQAVTLYKQASEALDSGDFDRAAALFARIRSRYPTSVYVPDSYYWEAFALLRDGTSEGATGRSYGYRKALSLLQTQRARHPNANTASDAPVLEVRIQGELARSGDSEALRALVNALERGGECSSRRREVKLVALSALQQVDPDRAQRYTFEVLSHSNPCATELRRGAVFILANTRTPEAQEMLIRLARHEDDDEVRSEAVYWLSQVPDRRAVHVLEDILSESRNGELKEKAVFALAQLIPFGDMPIFESLATSRREPSAVRIQAIDWLARQASGNFSLVLRSLYERERSSRIREAIVLAVADQHRASDGPWMLSIAMDSTNSIEVRRHAVYAAAQALPPETVYELYERFSASPLREQIILALAQSSNDTALDRLIHIAASEKDNELRDASIFWLRQSTDPRAIAFVASAKVPRK